MPVEDWRLQQKQRGLWDVVSCNLLIVPEYARFHRIKSRLRSQAVTGHHVEGDLRIENIFGQRLERKQIHGLLVQFVHAPLSMLGGRLEDGCHYPADRDSLLRAQ